MFPVGLGDLLDYNTRKVCEMKKIIIVTSCSSCPYRHSHWSPSVYMGSSCGHRDAEKLGIYGLNDREEIHEKCPLSNADE